MNESCCEGDIWDGRKTEKFWHWYYWRSAWGTHFCQFYQTKEDLLDILVPYFKTGLENNEFCIWVIPQELTVEDAEESLRRVVPGFDIYLDKGQIEIVPYTLGYVEDGGLDPEKVLKNWVKKTDQSLECGYDGLRLSGHSFWLETHWQDFVYYEDALDTIIGKYRMIVLCTYYLEMCKIVEIAEMVSNHQFALAKKKGKWQIIENSGRKRAEEALAKIEETRIKEIHHRIKNNLQVISSLLDLQAETFSHLKTCNASEVIDAFKDSQNRIVSMVLIHQELYKGKGTDNLNFAAYIQTLTKKLFSSYNLRNEDVNLKLNLEEAYLGMDTAIPLGIIVNELVSNSLKHAFPSAEKVKSV
ncbi:MEDS domain-containing protein [Methanosarcina horonobensis]|uniref:MEDS domain-containing protein n=1 Tax=Methanosarcina horonobensis TaxID=418008 RepID=UPI000A940C53|nr:MEDS domain-containing protein [Methanosarcina horonobensis]